MFFFFYLSSCERVYLYMSSVSVIYTDASLVNSESAVAFIFCTERPMHGLNQDFTRSTFINLFILNAFRGL
jgi:hypothetical protein